MSLDSNQVTRIAQLARLSLTAEDGAAYEHELGRILDLVDQLNGATTDQVTPLAHPLDLSNRLRPDEVTETDRREAYQSTAPTVAEGYYLVPKVID